MKKVVFFTEINKISEALGYFNIEGLSGKKVPIKLHMGEIKNKFFSKPELVKPVVSELKNHGIDPFLFDTTVAYLGLRHSVKGYHKVAKIHGFTPETVGCDVVIDDTGVPVKVDGRDYEVANTLMNTSHIFAFTHVKGHIATGMGGAIKNFGMGGVTKETKRRMHQGSKPVLQPDKCTFCSVCAEVCPFNAIRVNDHTWKLKNRQCFGCGVCVENCNLDAITFEDSDFQYVLACAAFACVKDKNVIYLNDVNRIARSCDCDPFAGPVLCPDIGFLLSDDIVAVDKASLDLIDNVKKDVFLNNNKVDPFKQIKYGEEIGLGSSQYQLIEI